MPGDEFKLDEESTKHLEQVRKGKPRRFVMLCKGATILSLVVFKKGAVTKFIKQAKEQGTGQAYHGVVTGKGVNLDFQLASSDGFDAAPTKDAKLKEFLNAATGESLKPRFEMVAAVEPVLDEDDALVQRFLALRPQMAAASEKSPEEAAFFNDLSLETIRALQDGDAPTAELKIVAIEKALGRLGTAAPVVSDDEKAWLAARDELQADLDRCLQENLGDTTKIRGVRDFAQGKAESKDFAGALKAYRLLKEMVEAALFAGKKDTDVIRSGQVDGMAMSLELRTARLEAVRGVAQLEEALRAAKRGRANEIADTIKRIAERFPNHLETLLEGLAKAQKSDNAEAVTKLKAAGKKAVGDWSNYLQKYELAIEGCEKNPWKIPVAINKPIRDSLKKIVTTALA